MSIVNIVRNNSYISKLLSAKAVVKLKNILSGKQEFYSYKVKGRYNNIRTNTSILKSTSIDIAGNRNEIVFGKGTMANDLEIFIKGNNNKIIIGDNCRFVKGGILWIEDDGCQIIIGKLTSFISAHLAATESNSKIIIGEDCMFAYDIDVRTGDSHSILDMYSGKRINYASDVRIGNHVWIAAHTIILKGVQIKDNCIVGSGSVVTKSCDESNVIYAGNPAVVVKKNIDWSRERI
jgi:acetyltransferase-like isoleucine patch superfamily enzyme